ncbi:undecaprenyl-phosphate glucose phosphotransferase [Salinicola sp. DM10]|uniref:undecaprenyl-phosphate glucose phosphotransferase n=1 Tax=Salinicola sp. DM10 TaxID=2815721 RepID=UPI001E60B5A9|nr:undecaprenyl-phosphate glucose phosphotransferase [Salinicola sp. DM10]MCE3027169.1 undecaprenyl-phosphate glucose phosphotransferase [Salinicola sp. DM10]
MKNDDNSLKLMVRGFDAFIAMVVGGLFFWCLDGLDFSYGNDYPLLIVAGALLLPAVGEALGLYRPWRGRSIFSMFGTYIVCWSVTLLLLSSVLVVAQSSHVYSRLWMGLSALGVLIIGLFSRGLLYGYLRHLRSRGRNLKTVLLIGLPGGVQHVRERLDSLSFAGYRVGRSVCREDSFEVVKEVVELAHVSAFERDFDEVWLSYPLSHGDLVKTLADLLVAVPVDVRYFPDLSDVRLLNHRVAQVADMFSIDLNYCPLRGASRFVKGVEDRLLALLLLVVFLPFMGVAAISIWLTMKRPILFKQYRHGLDGERVKIYKFRTMRLHDDGQEQTCQAQFGDPRVTRLGRWLRRTSLDELPQLYNVLQGRMSLVGPRPHAVDHNALYKDLIGSYMQRHRVKPGITGWAQVHGLRGIIEDVADMERRVEYDLYYIKNWSLGLDFKILLLTVLRGFLNNKP